MAVALMPYSLGRESLCILIKPFASASVGNGKFKSCVSYGRDIDPKVLCRLKHFCIKG